MTWNRPFAPSYKGRARGNGADHELAVARFGDFGLDDAEIAFLDRPRGRDASSNLMFFMLRLLWIIPYFAKL